MLDLGALIPPELYEVIAEVLAWAYRANSSFSSTTRGLALRVAAPGAALPCSMATAVTLVIWLAIRARSRAGWSPGSAGIPSRPCCRPWRPRRRELHRLGATRSGRGPGARRDGEPAWVLPVTARQAATFAPKGPDGGPAALPRGGRTVLERRSRARRLEDWRGYACLVAPGIVEELAPRCSRTRTRRPARPVWRRSPTSAALGGPAIPLAADPLARGDGAARDRARAVAAPGARAARPARAAAARAPSPPTPRSLAALLRERGCAGETPSPRDRGRPEPGDRRRSLPAPAPRARGPAAHAADGQGGARLPHRHRQLRPRRRGARAPPGARGGRGPAARRPARREAERRTAPHLPQRQGPARDPRAHRPRRDAPTRSSPRCGARRRPTARPVR